MEFPDNSEEEFDEKLPEQTRSSWMGPVVSCVFGLLLAAAIAGVCVTDLPEPRQPRMFLIYFLVLAPLFSFGWYCLFYLLPKRLAKRMKDQQANPVDQQTNPFGSGPIHPK